jgi:type IV pilus assembly protein PilC
VTLRHRIRFYQQLAVLARAGVPMRSSLQRLETRLSGGEIVILSREISDGRPIGEAFTTAGFSPFECHLVAAGERSAQLEIVFERLAGFWTRELHLFQSLTRSLYYPIVVLHLSIIVGSLLQLPKGTTAVIVYLVENFAWLYAIGFVLYVLVRASWRSEAAQRFWHFLPIIGGALSTACAYRWITALKLEYTAGVPLPDAVSDAWLASGYVGASAFAQEGEREMRAGNELSGLIQRWRKLPRDWVDFVETGEISGALETAFTNLEAEAARSWQLAQERMTEWLPKIFVFLVLIVAAVQIVLLMQSSLNAPFEEVDKLINSP